MRSTLFSLVCTMAVLAGSSLPALAAQTCQECHQKHTPGIVQDWKLSAHSRRQVGCVACHGREHRSEKDVNLARAATPETCRTCHAGRVEEFMQGKHAKAWDAAISLPTTHWQPTVLLQGMKECTACHKIGIKSAGQIKELHRSGSQGAASCDACHSRHLFSVQEARSPRTCRTCHTGIDHPQWEMFESNKHGVRAMLIQEGTLPREAAAPTCQSCHMPDGSHANRTAWGYLAVSLPLPFDLDWTEDRTVILKALGLLDPEGEPTPRLELFKTYDVMRFSRQDWLQERERMLKACTRCHSGRFASSELDRADLVVREADRLLAAAVREVADLYAQQILEPPQGATYDYPDLLSANPSPAPIETSLFTMFIEHRMAAVQGALHSNPNYAFWHGMNKLRLELQKIRLMAVELRYEQARSEVSHRVQGEEGKKPVKVVPPTQDHTGQPILEPPPHPARVQ